jgi:hypothetical protein
MEKEEIIIIAQLLTGLKDAVDRLDEAHRRKDLEKLNAAKKEILNFQKQLGELL